MKKALLAVALIALPIAASPMLTMPSYAAANETALGDLSEFKTIAADTLAIVDKGDLASAEKRITDFESAWDAAEPALYPKNKAVWGVIDDAADAAIGSLRAGRPDASEAKAALTGLIAALDNPSAN